VDARTPIPPELSGFRVGYVMIDYWDYRPSLWQIEPPYSQAQLLVDWVSGYEIYTDPLAWSHDGTRIAFAHFVPGNASSVSVVDVQTSQLFDSDLSLPREGFGGTAPAGYLVIYPEAWSPDDSYFVATRIYEYWPGPPYERIGNYLVNARDLHAAAMDPADQFLSWEGPTDPLRYLYLHHPHFPDLGDESICLRRVGQQMPIACVGDFGEFDVRHLGNPTLAGKIGWRGDATPVVTALRHGPGQFDYQYAVLALHFEDGSWEAVCTEIPGPVTTYSPDARWLLFIDGDDLDLSLWDITLNRVHHRAILPGELLFSYRWSHDSQWLVFQQGTSLLALRIDDPARSLLLLDPADAGVTDFVEPQLWLPPPP
jgi:hypothetical protein